MTDKETIEEKLKKLGQAIGTDDSIAGNVMSRIDNKSVGESKRIEKLSTKFIARRIIMNRFTKLAAAAVIIIAVGIGTHYFTGDVTTPVYGITEALEVYRNANTVHITGWIFFDKNESRNEDDRKMFPFEEWIDKQNGCFRRWRPLVSGGFWGVESIQPYYFLRVSDGQYIMSTGYTGSQPIVRFIKLSPLEQRLQLHRLRVFESWRLGPYHLRPDEIEGFTKVGEEQIDDKVFHVWEGKRTRPGKSIPYSKLRIWLSPSSGKIGRTFEWSNAKKDTVCWRPSVDIRSIEYNATPPPDCFKTEPPKGFELENTKEGAIESKAVLREFGPFQRYYECIGFTLNDGSVILVWHGSADEYHLFNDLEPGGPLPELSDQIASLIPWPVKEDISCVGHHLAYTQKASKFYEWGIYVAPTKMPDRSSFVCYSIFKKSGVADQGSVSRPCVSEPLVEEVEIRSEEDFNTLVLGAMAELSADGKAPENVTYERVLRLAEQIRESLVE